MHLYGGQVCGPPGLMKFVSGGKAKDKSQGEVSKRCSRKLEIVCRHECAG